MFTLIFACLVGLGIAFFAAQNTMSVPIVLYNYSIGDIPLYVVIVGSLFVGIAISAVINAIESLASSWTIYGKEKTIDSLQGKIHHMELELAQLKGEKEDKREVVEKYHRPSFVDSLRHKLHFQ